MAILFYTVNTNLFPNRLQVFLFDHSINRYTSITSITHTHTHNYPNYSGQILVLSLSNDYFSQPRQEKTAIIPIWSIPSQIHLWLQNLAFYATYSMTSTSLLHRPHITEYKVLRVLCYLISTVHIPTIQQNLLPPIIHKMPIIILHMSTQHHAKDHHNSQPS